MNFRKILFLLMGFLFINTAFADDGFIVKNIVVKGLVRISPSTVRNYISIHEGQRYTYDQGDRIIQSLYQTGFFNHVSLARHGGTLIVTVQERSVIGLLTITGNKAIKYKRLQPVLKQVGLVEGLTFNTYTLKRFVGSLQQEYGQLGYHAAKVTSRVTPMSRGLVKVDIFVHEGQIAKVHEIEFVGNHAFSERQLRNVFILTTPGLFTWYNHNDRYTEQKLLQDLDRLEHYYMNRGYLQFRVLSKNVTLSNDGRYVTIVVNISEGPLYHVGGFDVAGQTLGHHDALYSIVASKLKRGMVFSRQTVIDTNEAVGNYLADRGYAFATARVASRLDTTKQLIFLNFDVVPGRRVYIRRIDYFGNQRTNEIVFRQQMRQMEGAPYSLKNIKESKHKLALLPFIDGRQIDVKTEPVPGKPDQVDLNYHVKEIESGKASLQVGYSDVYGFLYGAGISEPDFMGSGKTVSIGFQNDQVNQNYNFNYYNPFYTVNGVGRGFNFFYQRSKFDKNYNFQSYTFNSFGVNMDYNFPLSENNSVDLAVGYARDNVSSVQNSTAPGVPTLAPSALNFLGCAQTPGGNNCPERNYNVVNLSATWKYLNLDSYVMPTSGLDSEFSAIGGAPIFDNSLSYYKLQYLLTSYLPLGHDGFSLNFLTNIGYGNGYGSTGSLPFFLNYYAGGIGSVPGYAPNSLGPYNNQDGQGAALGGNLLTTVGLHLIFPNFFSNQVRVAATIDAGSVFQTPRFPGDNPSNQIFNNQTFSLSNLRTSAGILVTWNIPHLGPVSVDFAVPLNKQTGDQVDEFQFSFGTSI